MPSMPVQYSKSILWPQAAADVSFRMVSNIAEDSQGRIYVAHRGACPLACFDKNGEYLRSIGDAHLTPSINYDLSRSPPAPIGREVWLHGLHIDPWDNIWTTDLGRHLVMKFDSRGVLLLTLGCPDSPGEELGHFNQPTAVAVGRSGNVYVADGYGNARIVKYSPEGRPLAALGRKGHGPGELQTPHALALDEKENIYVAERMNNRVQVFDSAGQSLSLWPEICRPDAILVRGSHVYVGAGYGKNTLYRFTRDGGNREIIGAGEDAFGYPHGIHLDAEGCFYIADPIANNAGAGPAKYSPSQDTGATP